MLLALPKSLRSFLTLFAPLAGSSSSAPSKARVKTVKYEKSRIRVARLDGQAWVVDEDLLAALETKPARALADVFGAHEYGPIPGTDLKGFTQAGAVRYLAGSTHYHALRIDFWLEQNVFSKKRAKRRR
jgi:hypothetical protein